MYMPDFAGSSQCKRIQMTDNFDITINISQPNLVKIDENDQNVELQYQARIQDNEINTIVYDNHIEIDEFTELDAVYKELSIIEIEKPVNAKGDEYLDNPGSLKVDQKINSKSSNIEQLSKHNRFTPENIEVIKYHAIYSSRGTIQSNSYVHEVSQKAFENNK